MTSSSDNVRIVLSNYVTLRSSCILKYSLLIFGCNITDNRTINIALCLNIYKTREHMTQCKRETV